jgi:prepilin-type N-terminal cleavage/methylation domain-containing protein
MLKTKQSGFTLVEIAIVLVIIGLLLGGVLKGQSLIESGKAKNAAAIFNAVSSASSGYQDRYRALPGDDSAATAARGGDWVNAVNGTQPGDANGIINATTVTWGAWNGWEHVMFWIDLYAAGFLNGNSTARDLTVFPKSPWGKVDIVGSGIVYGMANNALVLCMENVPGKAAAMLDNMLDDGNPQTGSFRATLAPLPSAGTPGITVYDEGQTGYNVCKTL